MSTCLCATRGVCAATVVEIHCWGDFAHFSEDDQLTHFWVSLWIDSDSIEVWVKKKMRPA